MPEKDEFTYDTVQSETPVGENTVTNEVPQKTPRTISGLYLDAEDLERTIS